MAELVIETLWNTLAENLRVFYGKRTPKADLAAQILDQLHREAELGHAKRIKLAKIELTRLKKLQKLVKTRGRKTKTNKIVDPVKRLGKLKKMSLTFMFLDKIRRNLRTIADRADSPEFQANPKDDSAVKELWKVLVSAGLWSVVL